MNESEWREYVQRFKDLLRYPVGDDEQGARQECRSRIELLHGRLPGLVFESYQDWFDQPDDEWVIRNLGHWLSGPQETELLTRLREDNGKALIEYLADVCLDDWLQQAQEAQEALDEEQAAEGATGDSDELVGTPNTTNWAASRTPGTYYYTYVGAQYLYSDRDRAPRTGWKTLPELELRATDRATAWGAGWCTPTDGDARYGGEYVFSPDRDGPWLALEVAEQRLKATEPASAEPVPWGSVWTKRDGGQWRFGLTDEGPWPYTDGKTAVRDGEAVGLAVDLLLMEHPRADPDELRDMVLQEIDQTAAEKGM